MKKNHKIRIIGGEYRSRLIDVIDKDGLRPTSSRSRETLFNWLQTEIYNAHCLDLFSGSGALGIESLSRGAKHVTFIERDPIIFKTLRNNIEALKIDSTRFTLIQGDAIEWLKQKAMPFFDIVYIDPPFSKDLYQSIFSSLLQSVLFNTIKALIIEAPYSSNIQTQMINEVFHLHREMKTQQSHLLYYKQP